MKTELARRQSNTDKLLELFRSRPLEWVHWSDLGELGGNLAWRTRVSDCRKIVNKEGHQIEWNGKTQDSRYRYVPYVPQGVDASTDRAQLSLGGWR